MKRTKLNIKNSRIGSSHYEVKYVDDLKDEHGNLLYGRIWQNSKVIKIDKNSCYETQLQALLHEDLHGIFWEYALEDDEHLVEPLSNGLFAFIVNNPKLIKLILKEKKCRA